MTVNRGSRAVRKIRTAAGHLQFRQTPLDTPLLLFFLTLFVGLWTAHSSQLALYKFWVLVAAIGCYYLVTAVPRRYAWWVAAACGPLAAALAVFLVTANGWFRVLAFIAGFFWPLRTLLSLRLFSPLLIPHANVIGGLIAMLTPLLLATLLYAWQERRRWLLVGTAVCLLIALAGLLATRSVAAWLALATALSIWALWPVSGRVYQPLYLRRGAAYALLLSCVTISGLYLAWPVMNMLLPGAGDKVSQRLGLAGGAWRLVQDYAWTGSGLATFPALYSEYVQVVPNFFVSYSNFYLDVWLESGIFGFLCLFAVWLGALWQLVQALWRQAAPPYPAHGLYRLRWATLASLLVMLLWGVTDDALYSGLGLPLLFFVPALAVLVSRQGQASLGRTEKSRQGGRIKRTVLLVTAVSLLSIGGWLAAFRQKAQAAWHANQGALLMDQALLVGWPQNQWHSGGFTAALEPATIHFEKAVALQSGNRTARQRLGLVAMLGRDFETAVFHLEQAYEQDPGHRGAAKMLAYAYVWQGQMDKAAVLLATIPEAQREMEEYTVWWQQQRRPDLADRAKAMAAIMTPAASD